MIRPLKKVSKFYASTRKEAEDHIAKMVKDSDGIVIGNKVIQKRAQRSWHLL